MLKKNEGEDKSKKGGQKLSGIGSDHLKNYCYEIYMIYIIKNYYICKKYK